MTITKNQCRKILDIFGKDDTPKTKELYVSPGEKDGEKGIYVHYPYMVGRRTEFLESDVENEK